MAGNQPIDRYLNDLRENLAVWHRRPGDVIDETADHLMERTAELERQGVDSDEAAARAIDEYGTVCQVADAHLRAARRPAIPTATTRAMGVSAMLGGLGWIVLPILAAAAPGTTDTYWFFLAMVFHAAIAASVLGCIGLWQRHGGLGPLAYAAIVPAVLALPLVVSVWPVPAWTVLLGAATLLFGLALLVRRIAPLTASLGLAGGLSLAAGAVLGSEILMAGSHREDFAYQGSPIAGGMMIVGMIVFGSSMLALGYWMRSEEPVAIPALPAPSGSPATRR